MYVLFRNFNYVILKNIILLGIVAGCIFVVSISYHCHAESLENDKKVVSYRNQSDMMNGLLKNMREHSSVICVSYPGICADFQTYKKNNYKDFFDRLGIKNGYYTGILSGYCVNINSNEESVTFQFNYLTTKRQERYINHKVKKIVRKYKGKRRVDKVKCAHDYLVKHMRYDARYYNPYYAFKKGRGLCMSYALAFQRMMNEMNIPCVYVKGKNHAWNMVKIGSVWYNVDVTWDDSGGTCKYFLKSDKDFPGHNRPASKYLKKLKKAKHSYFYRK